MSLLYLRPGGKFSKHGPKHFSEMGINFRRRLVTKSVLNAGEKSGRNNSVDGTRLTTTILQTKTSGSVKGNVTI